MYAQDAIGRWYCCNDSYVSLSTLQEVLSEKVYILFFSRAKQRPRTRVDAVVNGSKSHESNSSKTSTMPKSVSVDKSVCNKQISNHQQETSKSTNGSRSIIQKSGCVEKPFSMKISGSRSETNKSNNCLASNGTKALTCRRSDQLETPANTKDPSDNQPDTCNITSDGSSYCNLTNGKISGACVEQVDSQESSDHHSLTSDSFKSKVNHEVPSQRRMISDSGSTSKVRAPGNMRIVFHKKEPREENGHTAASLTSAEKERTGLMSDGNSMGQKSADKYATERGLSSLPLSNGNGHVAMDSLEGRLHEVNGSAHTTDSKKSLKCQDLPNENTGASNNSLVKRKIEDDCSCIFFARDDQSRTGVEAFKES